MASKGLHASSSVHCAEMASGFDLLPLSRPTVELNIKIAAAPAPPVARCIPRLHCSIPGLSGGRQWVSSFSHHCAGWYRADKRQFGCRFKGVVHF